MPNNSPRRLVEFSRSALDANLDAIRTTDPSSVIDIRCDAYGHGADWVRGAAEQLGFDAFITDDEPLRAIPDSTELLYGISAGRRVATLTAELVAIKSIVAGEHVSYGYTWTAERESRLGLVSLGFADGLPRAGSNVGSMTVDGRRVPVVGRIAMDQCVVDITGLDVATGASVSVWDSAESVSQWSSSASRNPLSLVSGLSWRVERSWTA